MANVLMANVLIANVLIADVGAERGSSCGAMILIVWQRCKMTD